MTEFREQLAETFLSTSNLPVEPEETNNLHKLEEHKKYRSVVCYANNTELFYRKVTQNNQPEASGIVQLVIIQRKLPKIHTTDIYWKWI